MAIGAASPRITSEAVVHAMRNPKPKTRYIVGYLGGVSRFLSSLPDTWADAIIRANRDREDGLIPDEEIDQFLAASSDETSFEL